MKSTTNAADFNAKLAALLTKRESVRTEYDAKRAAVKAAKRAAAEAWEICHAVDNEIAQLHECEAERLTRRLHRLRPNNLRIIPQEGTTLATNGVCYDRINRGADLMAYIYEGYDFKASRNIYDVSFYLNVKGEKPASEGYGRYHTVEQADTVIDMFKAAVKRGDTEFKFPTVAELERAAEVNHPESKGALRVTFGVNEIFDMDDENEVELLNEFEGEIRAIDGVVSCRIDEQVCVICDGATEATTAVENVLSRYGFRFNRYVWRDERIHTKATE